MEEAVLAVGDGQLLPLQAGGTVQLTVVLVKPAVGAAHWQVAGPARLQAAALSLSRGLAEHAPAPAAAELLPTGGQQPTMAGKPCQVQRKECQLPRWRGQRTGVAFVTPPSCEDKLARGGVWGSGCPTESLTPPPPKRGSRALVLRWTLDGRWEHSALLRSLKSTLYSTAKPPALCLGSETTSRPDAPETNIV